MRAFRGCSRPSTVRSTRCYQTRTSVEKLAKTLVAPLVPAGTIAALATTLPSSSTLRHSAWTPARAGQVVGFAAGPPDGGTTVKFSEYAGCSCRDAVGVRRDVEGARHSTRHRRRTELAAEPGSVTSIGNAARDNGIKLQACDSNVRSRTNQWPMRTSWPLHITLSTRAGPNDSSSMYWPPAPIRAS